MSLDRDGFHSGMTNDEVLTWLSAKLNRRPTSTDLYTMAKDCYHDGQFQEAARALEVYSEVPGKQLSGVHLLGYSYYMCGETRKAIDTFKACVNGGFDADWQLLIELQQELELELERSESGDPSPASPTSPTSPTLLL